MRTLCAVFAALVASACYSEARVVKREHIDDGEGRTIYRVREAPIAGSRVVVRGDREAVTREGDRVIIRTDPISGQTTIVSPDRHHGEVVAVRPAEREGEPVLVIPEAPRRTRVILQGSGGDAPRDEVRPREVPPRIDAPREDVRVREPPPRSEALAMWAQSNPDANDSMCLWAERFPDAAGRYFEWEALHPDRAREVMAWSIEHRDAGAGALADARPAAAELFGEDRAAASAYLDWVRKYPRAAQALLGQPRALEAAGAQQSCRQ